MPSTSRSELATLTTHNLVAVLFSFVLFKRKREIECAIFQTNERQQISNNATRNKNGAKKLTKTQQPATLYRRQMREKKEAFVHLFVDKVYTYLMGHQSDFAHSNRPSRCLVMHFETWHIHKMWAKVREMKR